MKCILRGGIAEIVRWGSRVSKGAWGGVGGDEGEGGRGGEVEEDIRACERVGGGEQAECRGVSQAAPKLRERGLSPKNVVRGGDEEWKVWPQKAGRNGPSPGPILMGRCTVGLHQ